MLFTFSFSSHITKNKRPRISSNTCQRDLPLSNITSTLNQLQNGFSVRTEEARALRYKTRLAEAQTETNETDEHQPQQPASSKGHRGDRGQRYTLRQRMELVEVFRHFSKKTDVKVTPNNFGKFMDILITRQSLIQWSRNFDKIKFDWLLEVRSSNGVVSGLQLLAAADSVLHILTDDILVFDDIPLGHTISFTTSWRSRMTREYSVAYCSLRGKAGSVNKDAVADRMNEIRNICSDFEPDNIYSCDETGMYLKELSTHSYTTEELASGSKPKRGAASCVSILFCVNASGSSLARARMAETLRPLAIGKYASTELEESGHARQQESSAYRLMWSTRQVYQQGPTCRRDMKTSSNRASATQFDIRYPTFGRRNNQRIQTTLPRDAQQQTRYKGAQIDELEQDSINVEKRPPLYPPVGATDASQTRRYYVRLVASVMDGDKIQLSLGKDQKDAQDMAEEIKQKVCNKIAKRYSSRDRSSSTEE
ncbi:Tigger transposable element-derived protein 6 [Haplosporangium gracile]|nr:Tigger transposable element-derived protein 6 [Haplosporangium gracile]